LQTDRDTYQETILKLFFKLCEVGKLFFKKNESHGGKKPAELFNERAGAEVEDPRV